MSPNVQRGMEAARSLQEEAALLVPAADAYLQTAAAAH
jgi:hypothetical protein